MTLDPTTNVVEEGKKITKTLNDAYAVHIISIRIAYVSITHKIKKQFMVATTNAVAKIAAVVAGLGLVAMSFASFAPAAKAMTADEIAAQIAALQAQLASLGGSSSASASFTMDLTLGSSGAEVTALQNWLISKGYSIPAGATGYFGAQTQAALAAYQAANGISPAAGYFGPITRAKVNAAGGSTGGSTGSTGGSTGLSGGAGSIEDATWISGLNNEEVGEDEEDVEVAGLEIEADEGSDLELTAVRIDFGQGSGATEDFDEYAAEVSVWFNGEEVARVDADSFTDDNSYSKTVSLDKGAVIDAGEMGDLIVAVSGLSNIDTAEQGDVWNVEIESVRFKDADGATITEDAQGDINGVTRNFSFESFSTAADVELKIAEDDEAVNDSRTIEVDATDDTDGVAVMSFTLEAEGDSDIEIKNWGVSVTVTGALNTDDVLSSLDLFIDDEEVATADTVSGAGLTEFYNFDDVDYTLSAGDTVSAEVRANFLSIADALDEGDTISFALGEEQTDTTTIDVEDEAGDNLADSEITGSVTSGAFELRSVGIMVTFVSATEEVTANDNAADNDVGTFVIKYNVEAFGDTVYVDDSAAPTIVATIPDATIATDGVRYVLEEDGTATVADVTDQVTYTTGGGASAGTNAVVLQEGEDADFTLTVVRTNNSDSTDDGLFRVLLKAIGWATTDTTTFNVYDFDLEDYKTDPVNLN